MGTETLSQWTQTGRVIWLDNPGRRVRSLPPLNTGKASSDRPSFKRGHERQHSAGMEMSFESFQITFALWRQDSEGSSPRDSLAPGGGQEMSSALILREQEQDVNCAEPDTNLGAVINNSFSNKHNRTIARSYLTENTSR